MAAREIVSVVDGEASESDSEEEVNTHQATKGLVVPGEASETDSEDEAPEIRPGTGLPPLKVEPGSAGDSLSFASSSESDSFGEEARSRKKDIPKYDTLLHRKLRDRNSSLRSHLESAVSSAYTTSTKDITSTSQQLVKSQMYVQDVSHNLRVLSGDLTSLQGKVDIIASCNILPTLHVPDSLLAELRDARVRGKDDEATIKAYTLAV
ncbi:biogenesis of lysosome-related organelles complex 1 subunit 3-like [Ptychodera flava]|uniref:biogenesis of lysosome-related organelles complex 1 subunit 3-like n=1 Tax=Ptychodera flava TaxID=63121 RepID=UPI00396A754B